MYQPAPENTALGMLTDRWLAVSSIWASCLSITSIWCQTCCNDLTLWDIFKTRFATGSTGTWTIWLADAIKCSQLWATHRHPTQRETCENAANRWPVALVCYCFFRSQFHACKKPRFHKIYIIDARFKTSNSSHRAAAGPLATRGTWLHSKMAPLQDLIQTTRVQTCISYPNL